MQIRPFPVSEPAEAAEDRLAGLQLPEIRATADLVLDLSLIHI